MLKEIIKVKFIPSIDSALDLGILDPCFDDVLLKGDYHINFAGHDQSIVFESLKSKQIKDLKDLSLAMRNTIQDYEIEGIQSLIFTFIGNVTDYVRSPIDYEFCVEL